MVSSSCIQGWSFVAGTGSGLPSVWRLFAVAVLVSVWAGTVGTARAEETPRRLLFVGNSFTYYNGGLETHMKALAASASPPRLIEADRATQGGATLRVLHGKESIRQKIRDGRYDIVILQEDIPELPEHSSAPFFEFGRRFDEEIRAAGGRSLLFMAWPYERLGWVALPEIMKAHRELGCELNVPVAPVGLAFERAGREHPEIPMLAADREHETLQGTYLAACTIYATLYGENPQGYSYRPEGVTPAEAAALQRIAAETVQAWQQQPEPAAAGKAP